MDSKTQYLNAVAAIDEGVRGAKLEKAAYAQDLAKAIVESMADAVGRVGWQKEYLPEGLIPEDAEGGVSQELAHAYVEQLYADIRPRQQALGRLQKALGEALKVEKDWNRKMEIHSAIRDLQEKIDDLHPSHTDSIQKIGFSWGVSAAGGGCGLTTAQE